MATPKQSFSGHFETTAQTMLEAVDKAGAELQRNVHQCVEQLSSHCFALQKSLEDQLRQVHERYQSFVEVNREELEEHQAKLIKRLKETEHTQIETIAEAGYTLRQALQSSAEQVLSKLSKRLEQELAVVKNATGDNITRAVQGVLPGVNETAAQGKVRLTETASVFEDEISQKAKDLEEDLEQLVKNWKKAIESKLETAQVRLQTACQQAMQAADQIADQSRQQMLTSSNIGAGHLDEAVSAGIAQTDLVLQNFRDRTATLAEVFSAALSKQRQLSEEDVSLRHKHKLSQAAQEIARHSLEAREKIEIAHQAYQRGMLHLEHDYLRQLSGLMAAFEITLAESGAQKKRSAGLQARGGADGQEKLEKQLAARGAELAKGLNKLAEQLHDDYVKSSSGLEERIESIREDAVTVMEKQIQLLKSDNDRCLKKFLEAIANMESHLDQIEEAGKAAAVTVMAYRSAHLSLGDD